MTDKRRIREILQRDRVWSLYALADLDDELFADTDFWGYGESLALVFHGIAIRPIFVSGAPEEIRRILVAWPEDRGYLNLRPEYLSAVQDLYRFEKCNAMDRMVLGEDPLPDSNAEALGLADAPEIEALYASGDGGGIAFGRAQLETGFFRGIRRDGKLVAVAGVHVVSRNEGVAGVGNIFTHPRYRGQGLATQATAAVAQAVRQAGIRTIGLNVERENTAAIRIYERLGFRKMLHYFEGPAVRQFSSAAVSG